MEKFDFKKELTPEKLLLHHLRHVAAICYFAFEDAIDDKESYDAVKLGEEVKVHIDAIRSYYSGLIIEHMNSLEVFCQVTQGIPNTLNDVYLHDFKTWFERAEATILKM